MGMLQKNRLIQYVADLPYIVESMDFAVSPYVLRSQKRLPVSLIPTLTAISRFFVNLVKGLILNSGRVF